jgi:L-fucose isomerase-like protein
MMDAYDCNAFSTACHELCTSEIPQQRKFTPCVCHSLLKDEGYPSGCEEDLNALLAMTIMQAAAMRPAFMGNPNMETDELLRIHHAVPALCMNGYGKKPLKYKLWAFTGQGFGGKLQVDFTENDEKYVTLGRFNPMADTISIKRGEVIKSEFDAVYCSPYYYIKMNDARGFMHQLAGFGHHQVLIFGDYTKMLHQISEVMGFKVMEHK